jgi:hypothetical protein
MATIIYLGGKIGFDFIEECLPAVERPPDIESDSTMLFSDSCSAMCWETYEWWWFVGGARIVVRVDLWVWRAAIYCIDMFMQISVY